MVSRDTHVPSLSSSCAQVAWLPQISPQQETTLSQLSTENVTYVCEADVGIVF